MTDNRGISTEIRERMEQRAMQLGLSVDDLLGRLLDAPTTSSYVSWPINITAVENTTDSIFLLDPDRRYIYANSLARTQIGVTRADIIGKTDHELGMTSENLLFWQTAWDDVIATGQQKTLTYDAPSSTGVRMIEALLVPIHDRESRLIYLLLITRDVTERNQSEEMLRDIANRLPGMILRYELKPDGQDAVPFVSESVKDVYEITAAEALTDISKVWAKVHPDDLPEFGKSIQESAENLSVWDYEWRIRMSDGSLKWMSGRGTPHRLDDGRIVWNTLLLDITERKQLEDHKQDLLDQLQLALQAAKLGMWRLNTETNTLDWNARQLEIYGLTRDTFVPDYETWRKMVHPEDLPIAEARLQQTLSEGKVFDVEFRIIRADGEVRHIQASADVVRGKSGHPTAMIGTNLDITERKQAEQAMLEREHLQANLNVEKERIATLQRIVAKLEHDIRTPLSVIATSRDILSHYSELIDEQQRLAKLETIGKQLTYVSELLNDLTRIQDVSIDEQSLRLAPHNLKEICRVTLQDIQTTTNASHHLTFDHDFDYDLVMIDNVLINRVLLNLLSNAVKYSPAGSTITLRVVADDERIVLRVQDQGIGMSAEQLEKIFTPFYRTESAAQHADGRGLGLSIVKDAVERLNGQIAVTSAISQGTTFTVNLPLLIP